MGTNSMTVFDWSKFNRRGGGGRMVKTEWVGKPLAVNLDPGEIMRPLAEAGAIVIREAIKAIGATIKPSTSRYREAKARAYAKGKAWAIERTGKRAPSGLHSDQLFNDSGDLAEQIKAARDGLGWQVETTLHGTRNRFVVANRLRGLVPPMRSAKELAKYPRVKEALVDALNVVVKRPLGKKASARAAGSVFGRR